MEARDANPAARARRLRHAGGSAQAEVAARLGDAVAGAHGPGRRRVSG